ncbi:MAG: LysR family transcriptional regulator [Polyangiaceae bacterium]|nr:LysR family transcriptional regulator [Polyangiaceae bacterium]
MALDLDDLSLFARIVERGSFAAAARELGVPTSTASRAVSRLEASVGAALLHRTSRAMRVTSEGRELYARISGPLAALSEAGRAMAGARGEPRGRLRVTAPADLGAQLLSPVVLDYTRRYPEVEVELCLTNRAVDLVAEGFDVALRATARLRGSSLIARKLTTLEACVFAAPSYLEGRDRPRHPRDLCRHDAVLFRPHGARWHLTGPDGDLAVDVAGRILADDYSFVLAAVMEGAGVGLLPRALVPREVAAGRLVPLLPAWEQRGASLYFVHASGRHLPPKLARFREVAATWLTPSSRPSSR